MPRCTAKAAEPARTVSSTVDRSVILPVHDEAESLPVLWPELLYRVIEVPVITGRAASGGRGSASAIAPGAPSRTCCRAVTARTALVAAVIAVSPGVALGRRAR